MLVHLLLIVLNQHFTILGFNQHVFTECLVCTGHLANHMGIHVNKKHDSLLEGASKSTQE